ncbi:MAG: SDR family oxidoreductase [Sphingomonadales bacterium]
MPDQPAGTPVALVTMATEHAGPAVARRLAEAGFSLMLQGADSDLIDSLKRSGAAVAHSDEDLETPDSARRFVEATLTTFGAIDAAWIRTGVVSRDIGGPFLTSSQVLLETVNLHNFNMLVYVLQALLPSMVAAGRGNVVVSTSAMGLQPQPNLSLYSATRAAAIALVRSIGLELAPSGVTINAVATNFLDAPSFRAANRADTPEGKSRVEARVPMKRLGDPEELAEFVAVLLDGRTRFQTGQCFSFSGGWSP